MSARIVITLDQHGEIAAICADAPCEVYINCPHVPADRVYRYDAPIGPEHVRAAIGGYAIGHAADGTLGEGDGTGKLPPLRPRVGVAE